MYSRVSACRSPSLRNVAIILPISLSVNAKFSKNRINLEGYLLYFKNIHHYTTNTNTLLLLGEMIETEFHQKWTPYIFCAMFGLIIQFRINYLEYTAILDEKL